MTKPVGAPLVSTIAQGHAAMEINRSASSDGRESSTRADIAPSATKSISASVGALYSL